MAVLDPDWESESGSRRMEIDQKKIKKPCFLPSKKGFCTALGMFLTYFLLKVNYIIQVKI